MTQTLLLKKDLLARREDKIGATVDADYMDNGTLGVG